MTPMQHTASQVLNAFTEGKAEAVIRLYELGLLGGVLSGGKDAVRKYVEELLRKVGVSEIDVEYWSAFYKLGEE